MNRYLLALLSLLVLLAGCVTQPDLRMQRLGTLPQHQTMFDAELAWRVEHTGSETLVDGEFRNQRFEYMDDVEIWVAVLDPGGRPVARAVSYLIPYEIRRNEVADFSVTLPVITYPGTKLLFTYNYDGNDGGDSKGNFMTQSFVVEVPGR